MMLQSETRKMALLLAEDDELAVLLQMLLEDAGCAVEQVGELQEAQAVLESASPALMAAVLPSVLREASMMLDDIAALAPLLGVPLLALSMAREVVAYASKQPVVSACLEAPFDIEAFQGTIRRLVADGSHQSDVPLDAGPLPQT